MVPHDAYKMDFVFSDVAGGVGTYDNRGGYDYHLPVEGVRVWFIEPRNGFFNTQSVYGRYDDEVSDVTPKTGK